jgi:hypothetical protein
LRAGNYLIKYFIYSKNMKKNLFMMFLAAAAMVFAGCSKDSDETPEAASELSVSPASIFPVAVGNSYTVAVTSDLAWLVAVNAEAAGWCTLSNAGAVGNGTIIVHVADNTTQDTRVATITVTAGTQTKQVAVMQAAATPVLEVDKTTIGAPGGAAAYPVFVTSNLTWTATVSSAATSWCTLANAGATGNGTVTVNVTINSGEAVRNATVTIVAGALQKTVTLQQAKSANTPPNAASVNTWSYGDQTWSDAIHIPACAGGDFSSSTDTPQCRSYTEGENTWYYYNFPYVETNADVMCPVPWRVPTQQDFATLVESTTRENIVAVWGYGGQASASGVTLQTTNGAYWSATPTANPTYVYRLWYSNTEHFNPTANAGRENGQQVRCVK